MEKGKSEGGNGVFRSCGGLGGEGGRAALRPCDGAHACREESPGFALQLDLLALWQGAWRKGEEREGHGTAVGCARHE